MRIVRLIATGVFVVIVGVIGAGAALLLDAARAPLPQINGNVVVTGITAQVQVLRDEYGVPHIYGSSLYDLFFAQGYTHAQDRWWQMDVFRHIARGSLQELMGARETLQGMDVFMRTLLLEAGAENEYRQMSDEAKALIDAFSDGVNAYISGRAPNALAMEYRLLSAAGVRVEIEPWSALDSIMWSKVIAWIFTSDHANELVRELMIETLDADMLADYAPPHPFGVPESISTQAFERSAGDDASRLIMAGGVRAGKELAPLGLTGGRMIGSA
jgi:penicillin amidase